MCLLLRLTALANSGLARSMAFVAHPKPAWPTGDKLELGRVLVKSSQRCRFDTGGIMSEGAVLLLPNLYSSTATSS